MNVRKLKKEDIDRVLEIYACARERMKRDGNPTQWGDSHPRRELIEGDAENGTGYVLEQDGKIVGVFAFLLGEDPTYHHIEGEWLNDEPYGTIHRIASGEEGRSVLKTALKFCESQVGNIRIDTHEDNAVMRHLLTKYGFSECGVIYVANGTPRIAYQKVVH